MATYKRQKNQTELAEFMVQNIATVMERERAKRGMGKIEFAESCGIKGATYFQILDGSANPTLYVITRISNALNVPVYELLFKAEKPRG